MVDGIRRARPYLRRILIVGVISIITVMVLVAVARPQITRDITSFEECVAAGGSRMESYPEQCMIDGKSFTNTSQSVEDPNGYVGLSEDEAIDKARSANKPHRVVERDGEALPVTMDFVEGRLNFIVKDSRVVRVDVEGETR